MGKVSDKPCKKKKRPTNLGLPNAKLPTSDHIDWKYCVVVLRFFIQSPKGIVLVQSESCANHHISPSFGQNSQLGFGKSRTGEEERSSAGGLLLAAEIAAISANNRPTKQSDRHNHVLGKLEGHINRQN